MEYGQILMYAPISFIVGGWGLSKGRTLASFNRNVSIGHYYFLLGHNFSITRLLHDTA